MAYNQNNVEPVNKGVASRQKYGLKESFNARLVASFKADAKLRRWTFAFVFANCTLLVLAICLGVITFHLREYWSQYNPFFEKYTGVLYPTVMSCMAAVCLCTLLSWIPLHYYNPHSIIVYGAVIFVMLVLQLSLLLYTLFRGASDVFLHSVSEKFGHGLHRYLDDRLVRDAVNYVQQNLLCCGAEDMGDWFDTATNALPHSCCWLRPSGGEHNCLVSDMLYVQTDSCLPKLKEIPSDGMTFIYAITACIIIIEIFVILLAIRVAWLYDQKRKSKSKMLPNVFNLGK